MNDPFIEGFESADHLVKTGDPIHAFNPYLNQPGKDRLDWQMGFDERLEYHLRQRAIARIAMLLRRERDSYGMVFD